MSVLPPVRRRALAKRCPFCGLKIGWATFLCPYCRSPLVPTGDRRSEGPSWPARVSSWVTLAQVLAVGWVLGTLLWSAPRMDSGFWAPAVQAAFHAGAFLATLAWAQRVPWGRTVAGMLSMLPLMGLAAALLLPDLIRLADPLVQGAAALLGLIPISLALDPSPRGPAAPRRA